jgi:DNA gyrase/topoisomerase IV subunit A
MHITYSDEGDAVLASNKGQFIRMALKAIKRLGRDTQGVTLMRLKGGDKVASVALILPSDEEEEATTLPLDIDPKQPKSGKSAEPEIEENPPLDDDQTDVGPIDDANPVVEDKDEENIKLAKPKKIKKEEKTAEPVSKESVKTAPEEIDDVPEIKINSYKKPMREEDKKESSEIIKPNDETAPSVSDQELDKDESVEAEFSVKKAPKIGSDDDVNYWGKQKGLYN